MFGKNNIKVAGTIECNGVVVSSPMMGSDEDLRDRHSPAATHHDDALCGIRVGQEFRHLDARFSENVFPR